jgi:hypothetical protein
MVSKAEMKACRAALSVARNEGRIGNAEACEACGVLGMVAPSGGRNLWSVVWHHPDYSKPLELIPLCKPCHSKVHRGNLAEPRTGRVFLPIQRRNKVKTIKPAHHADLSKPLSFGSWLKSRRILMGMDQAECAAHITKHGANLSYSGLSRLESNSRRPSFRVFATIAMCMMVESDPKDLLLDLAIAAGSNDA